MIRLSMEIPTKFLREWSALCDLDFALAHKVLEDSDYAEFYAKRPVKRELILDNSMHELGRSLSVPEIAEAANRCRATFVIAPDRLREPRWNYEQFKLLERTLDPRVKTAVVMSGRDPVERDAYLENVRSAHMLCLPYREPRSDWWEDHRFTILKHWTRVHLLGVSSLEELRNFVHFSISWSVDTSKPIKWGLEHKSILDIPSLRNAPTSSASLLDLSTLTIEQEGMVYYNVAALRTFLV